MENEYVFEEMKAAHERCFGITDFSQGRFTVRVWDGMDGCWCDCDEATNVSAEVALKVWYDETARGTKKVSFNEIDYYKIFPADTRMHWDGTSGREMFRDD